MKGGKLIFAPKGAASSASGKALPTLTLTRGDLTRWSRRDSDRAKFGSVRAKHRDLAGATTAYVVAGSDAPVKTLRHVYPSQGLATDAAHAEHKRLKRKASGITLDLAGDPSAAAGSPVVVRGVREGVDGDWIAAEVDHAMNFADGGYTVNLTATVDGKAEDTGDGVEGYGGDAKAQDGDEDEGQANQTGGGAP